MRDLLPFVVVGLTSGSLYGLAGMGLVLTFRTSGVFNFAHGAMAAFAAYLFYDLHSGVGLPWPVALVLTIALVGVGFGLVLERLALRLQGVPPLTTILATVGLLLAIQGYLTWKYGPVNLAFPDFFPKASVGLFGVRVSTLQIVAVAVALVSALGLWSFLRSSRLGAAMRGVVEDPDLLAMAGTRPVVVRRSAWIIGCSFAALTGVLIAPSLGRDPFRLTLLVVQAFGAAAVGGFTHLLWTYAGGLLIGLAAALCTHWVGNNMALRELPAAIPFVFLFTALLLLPGRRLIGGARPDHRLLTGRAQWSRPVTLAVASGGGLVLGVIPFVVGAKLPVYTSGLIFVLVFLSLALLMTSGQISLGHAVFVALGGTTFAHLTTGLGLPWFVALVLTGLAVVPLGALVAIPAVRLSGIYLALATFGLSMLMQRVVFGLGVMFGRTGLRSAPRPDLGPFGGGSDRAFYYVVLAVVVASCVIVALLARTRLGRLLRALGDSPVALSTQGLKINLTRLFVFCIAAMLAGGAGALFAANTGTVSINQYGPFESLLWVTVLAISGRALLGSPIVAAALLAILPAYASSGFVNYQPMLFGALAILSAATVRVRPGGERTAERLHTSPSAARLRRVAEVTA